MASSTVEEFTLPLPAKMSHYVVEVTLACTDLVNMDIFSKTDACIVAQIEQLGSSKGDKWKEIGRTEVVENNLNPQFSRKITLRYVLGERQLIRFQVCDVDWAVGKASVKTLIGCVDVALSQAIGFKTFSTHQADIFEKGNPKKRGRLHMTFECVQNRKDAYLFQFTAQHLPPTKLLHARARYFFELHKNINGEPLLVYRSEPASTEQQPWKSVQRTKFSLCSDDETKVLYLSLWKYKDNGEHKRIGGRETTLHSLLTSRDIKGCHPLFQMSPDGSSIKLLRIDEELHATFLDLILFKGVTLHYYLAIDFSSSNGDQASPSSLHYLDPGSKPQNRYYDAISSVLDALQHDPSADDICCMTLGFGAYVPPHCDFSDCFYMNGDEDNSVCIGKSEVLRAYKSTLGRIRFSEPTNLAPTIELVSSVAEEFGSEQHYFVLVIFTDGQVSDMKAVVNAIVAAGAFALSIIIVGVGSGPFDKMTKLDADQVSLVDENGVTMSRDIVQFVNYADVIKKSKGDLGMSQIFLARELFHEAPCQYLAVSPIRDDDRESFNGSRRGSFNTTLENPPNNLLNPGVANDRHSTSSC